MIIVLGFLHRNSDEDAPQKTFTQQLKLYVPWFVAGFLLLATLRSLDVIGAVGPRVAATVLASMTFMILVGTIGTFALDLT